MSSLVSLESKIGYVFVDKALLTRAVTHRSFASKNNERLEFLGDSILGQIVAEYLFLSFEEATESGQANSVYLWRWSEPKPIDGQQGQV